MSKPDDNECVHCDGTGVCSECDGTGEVDCPSCGRPDECGSCDGSGDCLYCDGTGAEPAAAADDDPEATP